MAKAAEVDSKGEPLYAPPHNVEPVVTVRGSVVVLDWVWLREQGHFEKYSAALGQAKALPLLDVTHSEWVDLTLGMGHWRALESLEFPAEVEYAIGKFVAERVHNVILATLLRLAGRVGVTPWTALAQCHRLWLRSWQGGGMAVYRVGEHVARIEVLNNPALKHRHLRNAMRGAIEAGIGPFCRSSVIQELTAERTPSSIVLRATWKL